MTSGRFTPAADTFTKISPAAGVGGGR
ncbi:hypothetical protein YPPY46_1937, partial [Yersinia pestis PY-46]